MNSSYLHLGFPFPVKGKAQVDEIRVCTNRSCRRQGSMQTFQTLTALAPPDVSVKSCGCLGRCGAGPNIALLPLAQIVGHCGTAAAAAELLLGLCYEGGGVKSKTSLDALALRMRAEALIDEAHFSEAERLLSQAIDLKPFGGIHILYKLRSVARLKIHDYSGALEDATQSLTLAPNYAAAYIRQGDAFLAMDQYDAAKKSYATCLQIDPSIRRSKSFKTRITELEEKLATINSQQGSNSET
ncbi:Tetratricopeptide-like helical [Corchorus olitorius]|uniref:Tetratricopeptide-like helical n=1 Tax=Corchorus olitorius TaxID=93759 RepID=A0A1R3KPS7_9ROSI|nr:Tetratricopeptide-like helical [Corchorus olitorius]